MPEKCVAQAIIKEDSMKRLGYSLVGVMGLAMVSLMIGCESVGSQEIQSRGVSQVQQPIQSASPGQPSAQLPTFPQKFEVGGPEAISFGFAVTQPGPIVVDVQGQGAPVIVTLQSPGGQPITQQATGNLRLNYNVTPQDVQKSIFWFVQIRLAQPMPPQQGGRAAGTLNVQYPPVNQTAVQQAVQAAAAQRRQPTDQEKAEAAARAKAQMDAAFQAHKARFEQQQQQRHAALMAAAQPLLAQMQNQTQAGGAVRPRGVEEAPASETPLAPGEDVTSRGLYSGTLLLNPTMVVPNPSIASACVPVPVQPGQPPQCVTQGQPGDPVMITGSNFGTSGGEIHFVIATGKDVAVVLPSGPMWTNTQIFTSVPDASGVVGFNGTVYVKRATDKVSSNLMLFRFNPLTELRQILCPQERDMILAKITYTNATNCGVYRTNDNWFWSPQGNDQFYVNSRLTNGWTVVQPPTVWLSEAMYQAGGAYLADSHVGTDSPYVNARFWVNAGSMQMLFYRISVLIQGPKGVPDGVWCTQIPCS
jgi:hypothetical protein